MHTLDNSLEIPMVHEIYANRWMKIAHTLRSSLDTAMHDLCQWVIVEQFNKRTTRFLHRRWWIYKPFYFSLSSSFSFSKHRKSIGYQSHNRIKWSISISGDIKFSTLHLNLALFFQFVCAHKVFFLSLFFLGNLSFFFWFLSTRSLFHHCWRSLKIPFPQCIFKHISGSIFSLWAFLQAVANGAYLTLKKFGPFRSNENSVLSSVVEIGSAAPPPPPAAANNT